jgi:hypothetical protein
MLMSGAQCRPFPGSLSSGFYKQNHAADCQDGACNRAVGNVMLRGLCGMNRSHVQNLVASLEAEGAPNHNRDSDDY